ncbi:hypothetical protein ACWXVT_02925 [Mycoplasma sp. 1573]
MNLDEYKTEIIGVSAEIAIAQYFDLNVESSYKKRANERIINLIHKYVGIIFEKSNIPRPISLVSQNKNSIDFILQNGQTLSVKTNKKTLGKVAPQNVGQATSKTYFEYFGDLLDKPIPAEYASKVKLFKEFTLTNISKIIERYWDNLFHCDYLIYIYEFLNKEGNLNGEIKFLVLKKFSSPEWNEENFSFTKTIENWNESNTVKYENVSIGEFQVHSNRDCFKFRFNMKKLLKILEEKNN